MTRMLEATPGGFCDSAWQRTADLQQAICDHPFNRALADGTLDRQRFGFYMIQDSRYLVGFSRALAAASTRAPNPDDAVFLAGSAQTALVVERSLHAGYLERFGVSEAEAARTTTSPTCLAYVSYLQATALTEAFAVLVAALLPCFWVYHHVGVSILDRLAPTAEHPYRAWIDTYADEGFARSVATAMTIADREATAAAPAVRSAMFAAFARATAYEWMFWDSAWHLEQWPTRQWLAEG